MTAVAAGGLGWGPEAELHVCNGRCTCLTGHSNVESVGLNRS